jgi:hypothetical protein
VASLVMLSSSFHTIFVLINHKKFHQDISISSKVINPFVFHLPSDKAKIGHLWYMRTKNGLILALRYAFETQIVNNFGTNRDTLMKFFVVDHHKYGVE